MSEKKLLPILHLTQNFYTTSGCDGCDKYEVCIDLKYGYFEYFCCPKMAYFAPTMSFGGTLGGPQSLKSRWIVQHCVN